MSTLFLTTAHESTWDKTSGSQGIVRRFESLMSSKTIKKRTVFSSRKFWECFLFGVYSIHLTEVRQIKGSRESLCHQIPL